MLNVYYKYYYCIENALIPATVPTSIESICTLGAGLFINASNKAFVFLASELSCCIIVCGGDNEEFVGVSSIFLDDIERALFAGNKRSEKI